MNEDVKVLGGKDIETAGEPALGKLLFNYIM